MRPGPGGSEAGTGPRTIAARLSVLMPRAADHAWAARRPGQAVPSAVFSWAIPTEEALDVLARYAPLVEGGPGTGYWAALLQARGVEAVAYDLSPAPVRCPF